MKLAHSRQKQRRHTAGPQRLRGRVIQSCASASGLEPPHLRVTAAVSGRRAIAPAGPNRPAPKQPAIRWPARARARGQVEEEQEKRQGCEGPIAPAAVAMPTFAEYSPGWWNSARRLHQRNRLCRRELSKSTRTSQTALAAESCSE